MSNEPIQPVESCCDKKRAFAYVASIGGSFLVLLLLAWLMWQYSNPRDNSRAVRGAERLKAGTEMRAGDAEMARSYGIVVKDKDKTVTRLPVDRAMEMSLELWKNPMAARSNLIQRAERAYPPPPAPKPSEFE
jgi:hypothetical protein